MTQFPALAYADWCSFVNDLRRIRRSPGRIAMWLSYGLLLGVFFVSRVGYAGRALGGPSSQSVVRAADVVRADDLLCLLVVTLAVSLASGGGAIGVFRNRAEARFVIGSPLAAPLALAYLQARAALANGLRLCFSFVYAIFIFGPRVNGPAAVAGDLVFIVAILATASAILVPRRLLPRPAGFACTLAGVLLAVLVAAPAVRDAVGQFPKAVPPLVASRIVAIVPAWHPGRVLLEPNPVWLFAVLAVAAGAITIVAAWGRDAYPEVFALSVARMDRLERRRQRHGRAPQAPSARRGGVPSVISVPAPAGVLVFVWKSVVEVVRGKQRLVIAGGALMWMSAGFLAGRLFTGEREELFSVVLGIVVNIMLVMGISAADGIAAEVRRPLFWLADTPLYERLCALALSQMWRPIVTLECIAIGFAASGGGAVQILVFAVVLPTFIALLVAAGFVAYTLFPSAADWRGPVAFLRFGVAAVMLVPPFAVFFIAMALVDVTLIALGAATLVALVEAGGLIGLAAWRLDGRIDRLTA